MLISTPLFFKYTVLKSASKYSSYNQIKIPSKYVLKSASFSSELLDFYSLIRDSTRKESDKFFIYRGI